MGESLAGDTDDDGDIDLADLVTAIRHFQIGDNPVLAITHSDFTLADLVEFIRNFILSQG